MENKIDIAALLKDCPKGTRLYSTICGECLLIKEDTGHPIAVESEMSANRFTFNEHGQWSPNGECLLFPSKEVRDWTYFRCKYMTGGDDTLQTLKANGGLNVLLYDCTNVNKVFFIDHKGTIQETEIGSPAWLQLKESGTTYEMCLPYNADTARLIGTADDWEGEE